MRKTANKSNDQRKFDFPAPVVEEQLSARQPHLGLIVLLYILPFWLLAIAFKTLLLWTFFAEFVADQPQDYQLIFFVSQASLICVVVIFSSIKFRSALWQSRSTDWHIRLACSIILLPALFYHLYRGFRLIGWVFTKASHANIEDIHKALWATLPYGPSLAGVIFSSVVMVAGPVFEEIIFTGFLLNIISKKYGVRIAMLTIPVIFTVCHIPQQGFGFHLLPILCSGLAFVFIRLVSGRLFYSVISHMIVNCIFLLPGWFEAYLFFKP